MHVTVNISVFFNARTEYTLEELKQKPPPEGVDPSRLEVYLNADDFQVKSSTKFSSFHSYIPTGWRGDHIVSAFDSGTSGPCRDITVFLGKTGPSCSKVG